MKCNHCGNEFGSGLTCQHCGVDKVEGLAEYPEGKFNSGGRKVKMPNAVPPSSEQKKPIVAETKIVEAQNIYQNENEIICYSCKKAIPKTAKFCTYCGIKLYEECPNPDCGYSYPAQFPCCPECGTNREDFIRVLKEKERHLKEENERAERERKIKEEDEKCWSEVIDNKYSERFLRSYLSKFPMGLHAKQSYTRLEKLVRENEEKARAERERKIKEEDEKCWSEVIDNKYSERFLRSYLSKFPMGLHAKQSHTRLEKLVRENEEKARAEREKTWKKIDEATWTEVVQKKYSKASLLNYIGKFPDGEHIRSAKIKLSKIDDDAWDNVLNNAYSEQSLRYYLSQYPRGRHLKSAQEALLRKDNEVWEIAKKADTRSVLKEYLNSFATPIHKEEAQLRIEQLKETERWEIIKHSRNIYDFRSFWASYAHKSTSLYHNACAKKISELESEIKEQERLGRIEWIKETINKNLSLIVQECSSIVKNNSKISNSTLGLIYIIGGLIFFAVLVLTVEYWAIRAIGFVVYLILLNVGINKANQFEYPKVNLSQYIIEFLNKKLKISKMHFEDVTLSDIAYIKDALKQRKYILDTKNNNLYRS